jgi:hypothetical protein
MANNSYLRDLPRPYGVYPTVSVTYISTSYLNIN